MTELLLAAPLAFTIGLLVGLLACSRWRIVRRKDEEQ